MQLQIDRPADPGAATAAPHLAVREISKRFDTTLAVDHVSLALQRGEFVALLGDSGCGKTTLLRMVAGFTRPEAGAVLCDGRDVTSLPPASRGMGFVFQSYALFPTRSVRNNIAFAPEVAGASRKAIARKVAELSELMGIGALLDRYPHELSGGQQQRVALARALAGEPDVLLLDEPMSALDARIRARLRSDLRSLIDRLGVTTLYVTHDQEEALALADRVAVMRRGSIEQIGTPAEIYHAPRNRFVAEFVGVANIVEGRAVKDGIQVGSRVWPCRLADDLATGSPALAVLRPERIRLDPQGLPGRLQNASFRGPFIRLTVALDNGPTLFADIPSHGAEAQVPPQGAAVGLSFAPSDIVVLAEGSRS